MKPELVGIGNNRMQILDTIMILVEIRNEYDLIFGEKRIIELG